MTSRSKPETVCLHPAIEQALSDWIQTRKQPAVLLIGEPGIGKTTIAHRVFEAAGLKTVEQVIRAPVRRSERLFSPFCAKGESYT
jgi:2-phosphoglycerate kinase